MREEQTRNIDLNQKTRDKITKIVKYRIFDDKIMHPLICLKRSYLIICHGRDRKNGIMILLLNY